MTRQEVFEIFARYRGESPAITGPSFGGRILYTIDHRPATLYNMELGYAAAVGLGVALACPRRRVLTIEGEGSFYAGATVLSTIWRLKPENLVVLVLDNGVWGTGDGKEPTATAFGLDLAGLARATGWDETHVHRASKADELGQLVRSALRGGGPHLIVGKTDASKDQASSAGRTRPKRHLLDCAVFMRTELSGDG